MRIDAYNAVSQAYQNNAGTAKPAKEGKAASKDALEISQFGRDLQVVKPAVADAPDVREDKVAQIKARMASGTYNVNAEEVADKLVDGFFNSVI